MCKRGPEGGAIALVAAHAVKFLIDITSILLNKINYSYHTYIQFLGGESRGKASRLAIIAPPPRAPNRSVHALSLPVRADSLS